MHRYTILNPSSTQAAKKPKPTQQRSAFIPDWENVLSTSKKHSRHFVSTASDLDSRERTASRPNSRASQGSEGPPSSVASTGILEGSDTYLNGGGFADEDDNRVPPPSEDESVSDIRGALRYRERQQDSHLAVGVRVTSSTKVCQHSTTVTLSHGLTSSIFVSTTDSSISMMNVTVRTCQR